MNTVTFSIAGVDVVVPILASWNQPQFPGISLPKNFGVAHDGLFRGSWPTATQLSAMQKTLGIKSVVTLHSSYGNEDKDLMKIRGVIPQEIDHYEIVVQTAPSFIAAAEKLLKLAKPVYVHCSAGANRTGKTVLIAQILLENVSGHVVPQDQLQLLLAQALTHGFDFNKPYKHVLEAALEILLLQGRIQLNPE